MEYQVGWTPSGADIAVRCQGPVDLAELADELRACLTRLGLAHPEVTLAPVRHIERHDSGKLKRFLPL